VEGILAMVETVGRLVGAEARAGELVAALEARIAAARQAAEAVVARAGRRPRVWFEEWDEPLISGIRWVSELIHIAGGEDVFPELAQGYSARERTVADPAEVLRRMPDIVIGSWCGKHFRPGHVAARPGWDRLPAVRSGEVHEIKSAAILTPGPVAIEEGLPALQRLFAAWAEKQD
jgi:iron complex transport system substrate-binding protein